MSQCTFVSFSSLSSFHQNSIPIDQILDQIPPLKELLHVQANELKQLLALGDERAFQEYISRLHPDQYRAKIDDLLTHVPEFQKILQGYQEDALIQSLITEEITQAKGQGPTLPLAPYEKAVQTWAANYPPHSPQGHLAEAICDQIKQLERNHPQSTLEDLQKALTPLLEQIDKQDIYFSYPGLFYQDLVGADGKGLFDLLSMTSKVPLPKGLDEILAELVADQTKRSFSPQGAAAFQQIISQIESQGPSWSGLKDYVEKSIWPSYPKLTSEEVAEICRLTKATPPQPTPVPGSWVPFSIHNDSKVVDDGDIYILIKGTDPKTGRDCFITFDAQGNPSYIDVEEGMNAKDYAVKLSDLPQTADGRGIYLPQLISGRIYTSIDHPLDMNVVRDADGALKIQDPDFLNPTDPNYKTRYDKTEFTHDGTTFFTNSTSVDYFSLPLSIQLNTSDKAPQTGGLTHSWQEIFQRVHAWMESNNTWKNLIEGDDTRVISAGKGMSINPPLIDPQLLQQPGASGTSWMDTFRDLYANGHTLSIDGRELPGDLSGVYQGAMDPNNPTQMLFHKVGGNPNDPPIVITLPNDSLPFFGGSGESFDASNNTPQAIIIRDLTAAVMTNTLTRDNIDNPLNKEYFIAHQKEFYQENNPLFPPDCQIYDVYSKVLHSFQDRVYSFSWDDVLGQEGGCSAKIGESPTGSITIGDLTGMPR